MTLIVTTALVVISVLAIALAIVSRKCTFEKKARAEGASRLVHLANNIAEQELAYRRLQGIVEASRILQSSLDYRTTFSELTRFITDNLCAYCAIYVYENGEFQLAGSSGVEAQKLSTSVEPFASRVSKVVQAGQSEFITGSNGTRLCAVIPLPAHAKVAGVLLLVSGQRTSLDKPEDVLLLEEIGRRAGVALEQARLYNSLQDASRLKDEFVAIASHELRTPLTPILGAAYLLRAEPNDAGILHRSLDLIERNAKAQAKTVEDLLDASRIISGKLKLNLDTVDLQSVVEAAIETVRDAINAKEIDIQTSFAPMDGTVYGDADRLQQVVRNLLEHSVKFTPNGGRVHVELNGHESFAQLRVQDSGNGIGQADPSRAGTAGGLGLGWTIVRHLVESHGGKVHASSDNDQGSVVTVTLPLRVNVREALRAQAGD